MKDVCTSGQTRGDHQTPLAAGRNKLEGMTDAHEEESKFLVRGAVGRAKPEIELVVHHRLFVPSVSTTIAGNPPRHLG